mgnify:CR=1 FL=1
MITAKVSDYRSHLSTFHKKVISDHDPLLISGKDGNVVILPEDDYENLIETIYILRDKLTMKSLDDTRRKVANNEFIGHEIKDLFSDVMER